MKQTFIKSAMLLLLILSTATTRAQEVALKTNLLDGLLHLPTPA